MGLMPNPGSNCASVQSRTNLAHRQAFPVSAPLHGMAWRILHIGMSMGFWQPLRMQDNRPPGSWDYKDSRLVGNSAKLRHS